MAQLNSIIGSILRDIISAQHEANLYSYSLSESYGKEGKVKDFQLPGVVISDMELELKYGVLRTDENQEQCNIRYGKLRQFIRNLCPQAAQTAITAAVSDVLVKDITRPTELKGFFQELQQHSEVYKQFLSFLTRNMNNAFTGNLYETVDKDSGELLAEAVLDKLMEVIRKRFLYDTDLDLLFDGSDGRQLREHITGGIRTALDGLVRQEAKDENFKRSKTFPQLDVAVTADELAQMPEEAIHSFKLKFTPTACNINSLDEEDELNDFDMTK